MHMYILEAVLTCMYQTVSRVHINAHMCFCAFAARLHNRRIAVASPSLHCRCIFDASPSLSDRMEGVNPAKMISDAKN